MWEEPRGGGSGWRKGPGKAGMEGGHAGAGGRAENPTRELRESPAAAPHFTGEGAGAGRELIKSE